jgi:hypothetical protein
LNLHALLHALIKPAVNKLFTAGLAFPEFEKL